MKVATPNNNEVTEFKVLSSSLNSNRSGMQGHDPRKLILVLDIDKDEMSDIWEYQGINTDERSAFQKMLDAKKHFLYLETFKVKTGLFSSAWLANVMLSFEGDDNKPAELFAGAVAAKTQAELWMKLKKIKNSTEMLAESPQVAAMQL